MGPACVRHNKLAQVWPKRFVAISLLVRRCLLLPVPLPTCCHPHTNGEKSRSKGATECQKERERKRKKFAAYAFITFFALPARVQKTLPGLVPSEMETTTTATMETMAGWITGTGRGSGSGSTPGGHISCARPHKLFKTCVPSVWLGVL